MYILYIWLVVVCMFVSNKHQNGFKPIRPRERLSKVEIKKEFLTQNLIF